MATAVCDRGYFTTESIAVVGASAGKEKANEGANPDADCDCFIGMLMHCFVGHFCAFNRSVADPTSNFPGILQCGSETLARSRDLFTSHVGGGGHKGTRIYRKCSCVMTDCVFVFIHAFYLFTFLKGKSSTSETRDGSGEVATVRTEFLPPNGLGTVSLANGSGIQ